MTVLAIAKAMLAIVGGAFALYALAVFSLYVLAVVIRLRDR
jgi:hypothetical protein